MHVTATLRQLRSLLRTPTYLLMALYCLTGYVASLGAVYGVQTGSEAYAQIWKLALALMAIAAWYINATAINDLADYEIDKINLKGDAARPLVTGAASRKQLTMVATICGVAALLFVAPLGLVAGGAMVIMLAFNAAYSLPPLKLSGRGGLALALLPLGYVGLTLALGVLAAGVRPGTSVIVLALLCYLQFLARISLKDHRDVVGDERFGKRTFLLRHGPGAVMRLVFASHATAGVMGAAWLFVIFPAAAMTFVFLACASSVYLLQLAGAQSWSEQRVWIPAYGRLASGQLSLLIIGAFIQGGLIHGVYRQILMVVLVAGVFLWSSGRVVARLHKEKVA